MYLYIFLHHDTHSSAVYIYIFVYVCVYVYVHVYTHMHTCTYMHIYNYTYMYLYTYTQIHKLIHVYIYIYIYIRMYIGVCVCVCEHTYMCVYVCLYKREAKFKLSVEDVIIVRLCCLPQTELLLCRICRNSGCGSDAGSSGCISCNPIQSLLLLERQHIFSFLLFLAVTSSGFAAGIDRRLDICTQTNIYIYAHTRTHNKVRRIQHQNSARGT